VPVGTLRVRVDGTGSEVIDGTHGGFPVGNDEIVLGHVAVGVIADAGETALTEGSVLTPLERRPLMPAGEASVGRGEPDIAPPEAVVERGIDGAHGFMAEFFVSPVEQLVELPPPLVPWGFFYWRTEVHRLRIAVRRKILRRNALSMNGTCEILCPTVLVEPLSIAEKGGSKKAARPGHRSTRGRRPLSSSGPVRWVY